MKSWLNRIQASAMAALLTLASSVLVIAENLPGPESALEGEEDELGIGISKSGYDKLKQGFEWDKETQRTDYYFDAFDGKSFVLAQLPTPYKLRLKDKEHNLLLQFSSPTRRETVSINGIPIYVRRTKACQIECNQSLGEQLKSLSERFFANIDFGGSRLLAVAEDFNQAWCANDNVISTKLRTVLKSRNAKIVPTQENTKKRLTLKCKLAGVKFKLFLEDKQARDDHGAWVHVYGLEAEPRSTYQRKDLSAAARALGELLVNKGLTSTDIRSARPDSTAFTLQQLLRK